jgi:GrpB-like predicted nucleotidyltransferase (UPF0157 family)
MVSPYDDPITLVSSRSEEWRAAFESERDRVMDVLDRAGLASRVRRVEHVGSTAVPELATKDIVDLNIVVEDDAVAKVADTLETDLGGTRYENTPGWNPVFREEHGQRFNDHVFGTSDDGWKVSVATVAVLQERPDLREEYEQLKREQTADTDELETYSRAKTAFIETLLDAADHEDLGLDFEIPASR